MRASYLKMAGDLTIVRAQDAWDVLSLVADDLVDVGFSPDSCQRLIDNGLVTQGKCLVIGGGTGASVEPLRAFGCAITLVDYSPSMVAKAQDNGFNAIIADASSLPFSDGCFDCAIIITGVIDCLDDSSSIEVIKQCQRVVKVHGAIFGALFDYSKYQPILNELVANPEENIIYRDQIIKFCLKNSHDIANDNLLKVKLREKLVGSIKDFLSLATKYHIDPATLIECIPNKDYVRTDIQIIELFYQAGITQVAALAEFAGSEISIVRGKKRKRTDD